MLSEHADEQARFDMFERINTGSKIANKAEVRRGALAGPFMTLIIELSKLELFKNLAPVSQRGMKERGHEELVSRFFAYADGLEGYRDRPSEFLFNYVKTMNEKAARDPKLIEHYRERFISTMTFVKDVFPNGFRKTPSGTATPRARFEAIAVGARQALDANPDLVAANVPPVEDWICGTEFSGVVGSDGANAISKLRHRTNYVRDRLLGSHDG